MDKLVAAVKSGLGLTPPQETKNKTTYRLNPLKWELKQRCLRFIYSCVSLNLNHISQTHADQEIRKINDGFFYVLVAIRTAYCWKMNIGDFLEHLFHNLVLYRSDTVVKARCSLRLILLSLAEFIWLRKITKILRIASLHAIKLNLNFRRTKQNANSYSGIKRTISVTGREGP
jgi:hypothetical protein